MKKKLAILDKNAHWWAKEKLDWATQDKDGNWWIIPGSEFPEKKIFKEDMMKMNRRKMGQTSLNGNWSFYILIVLSILLGVSLAINLVYSLM